MDNTPLQSHLLKTFTANFDPEEDRIRLDCDLHIEKQAQIFFTQRLGRLFISELIKKIETLSTTDTPKDATQEQKTSRDKITEPVSITDKANSGWLIRSIDFENLETGLRIIFKDNDKHALHLEGDKLLLQNIIDVFFKMFSIAEWKTDCFPSWVNFEMNVENQSVTIH